MFQVKEMCIRKNNEQSTTSLKLKKSYGWQL